MQSVGVLWSNRNVRTNVICERAVFNRLNQNDSDSVDDLITRLYSQVDKCRYGNLQDEMLRENCCWHKRQVFVREAAIRLGIKSGKGGDPSPQC